MYRTTFLILIVSFTLAIAAACGGSGDPANKPVANTNANIPATNSNNPLAVSTPTPAQVQNDAPTLGPVFKAFCAAVEKKDDAALRKVYSSESLRDAQKIMDEDGISSLGEYFSQDGTSSELCEVKNETINGDTGTAQVTTKSMKSVGVVFVKEDGQWKVTNRVPGFEKK